TVATINGNITMDSGSRPFTVGKGSTSPGVYGLYDLIVNANLKENASPASILKDGAGSLRWRGTNTISGTNVLAAGTLQVDGVQAQSAIQISGGKLQGNGTIVRVSFNGTSGAIAPGASPGILTCSSFNAGATGSGILEIELNGTTPGTGYDQINARGTVTLTGVTLNPTLNFPSSAKDQFTIINNDGSDAVVG